MTQFNVICNETSEVLRTYEVRGAAQRYANKVAKYPVSAGKTFSVEEIGGWVPCETDPTAEKKDAALFA